MFFFGIFFYFKVNQSLFEIIYFKLEIGWGSNFLQGNINNPNMFAKLINKKYKPSKVRKGEILTSKQNPTKLIEVKIAIY